MVENKDIGFVHAGQRAAVKIEAFTFTRYGLIDGHVTGISRDVAAAPRAKHFKEDNETDPEADDQPKASYSAHVVLDRDWIATETGHQPLGPGMAVTVEILTGRRPIIDYLLSPIARKSKRQGMRGSYASRWSLKPYLEWHRNSDCPRSVDYLGSQYKATGG